jgi:gamma-glutamylcyclotransferase (GGCT)/AIG2-like uncharacterized protein YtfP
VTPPSRIRYVFVYGTLRRGEQRDINRLTPAPRWLGQASVEGVLYDLGQYPGLVLGRDECRAREKVRGEIYEITEELERLLDEIEEVAPKQSGEYVKRQVQMFLESSHLAATSETTLELTCLVYEAAPERVEGCAVISSGDWVGYRSQGPKRLMRKNTA